MRNMEKEHVCIPQLIVLYLGLFIILVGLCLIACDKKQAINQVIKVSNHGYTCNYNGTNREFLIYEPEQLDQIKGILFMLHGYGGNAESFQYDTEMDTVACPKGYVTVYVTGYQNPDDSTSSTAWNSGIGDSSVDDMGYLKALANYLQTKYNVKKTKTFLAGFSNGAFMAHRVAVEGQDSFAGIISVAGMMPASIWKEREETAQISFLQIYGTKDDVVPMDENGSSGYAVAPAIEKVIDYYASANHLSLSESTTLSKNAQLTKYYEENKKDQVWQVVIEDGRHSWPSKNFAGFDTNELILEFMDAISE